MENGKLAESTKKTTTKQESDTGNIRYRQFGDCYAPNRYEFTPLIRPIRLNTTDAVIFR